MSKENTRRASETQRKDKWIDYTGYRNTTSNVLSRNASLQSVQPVVGKSSQSQTSQAHFAKISRRFDLLDEFLGLVRLRRAQKPEFSKVDKVNYLNSLLEGPAR